MKTTKASAQKSGFSIPELLSVLGVVGILAGMGFSVFSNVHFKAKEQKLRSDVATLNSAVSAYLGFGGNLDSVTKPEAVIAQLRSVANSEIANQIPGLSSSLVDRRIAAVMQTEEEAETNEPRVIWDGEKKSFKIATRGDPGISSFYLNDADAEMTPDEEMREFAFLYASENGWVWDFNPDTEGIERNGPSQFTTYSPITITNNEYPPNSIDPEDENSNATPLSAPIFSMSGGSYSIREFPLSFSIVNPNPEGSSDIYYQTDHGSWTRLEPDTTISAEPDTLIVAQSIALNTDFSDSSATENFYEASPVKLDTPAITSSAGSFGVFNNRLVLVSLDNPNEDDPAEIQYSINDGPWLPYDGIFIMDKVDFKDGALVNSRAISENEYYLTSDIGSQWVGSSSLDVEDSDGAFHDPTGPGKMETNLTPENPYNNYFEWGAVTNKWGEIDADLSKSWMDFSGIPMESIDVGTRFKLGDITYYDGVFKPGTHANKVRFAVGLGFDSDGVIYNTEFDYLFNIAHTTNGQSSFGNARLIMPNSISSYEIDGIVFDLFLEFGLPGAEYDIQPESTTSSALYGTLHEREEDASPRQNRYNFSGVFADFWKQLTDW